MVFRLFAGAFGASIFSVPAGIVGELFKPHERGPVSLLVLAVSPLLGPVFGPFIGVSVLFELPYRMVILMNYVPRDLSPNLDQKAGAGTLARCSFLRLLFLLLLRLCLRL